MCKYLILVLSILVVGCGQRSDMSLAKTQENFAVADEARAGDLASAQPLSSSPVVRERMLIRTGQLSMEVADVGESRKKIGEISERLNAYISEERLENYGSRLNISMTVRVPSISYDSLVSLVEQVGEKTENKSVNTQDVTEEFIDTEARLKTKKELEIRYREILKQANSVTDILSVESQLNSVRGEIESMEGRLKYLSSQVAFSTLSLTFYQSIDSDFGFAGQLGNGIKNGWTNLLSFIIGLVNIWPFLILITGGVWFFFRWKRKKKMNTTQP